MLKRALPALLVAALLGSPAAAEPALITYVVAPLVPLVAAKPKNAQRATKLLREAIRKGKGVRLVPVPDGYTFDGICLDACLMKLAKAAGAQRAVGGDLMMQPKVYFAGVHWHITLQQVDVARGGPYGGFETVYVSSISKPLYLKKAMEGLRDYDESKRLPRIAAPPPIPPGVKQEPGTVYFPAGDFIMGSDFGEHNDGPRHKVWLDAFYADIHETSNAKYKECVAAGVCDKSRFHRDTDNAEPLGRDDFPVAGINYAQAQKYCEWRGKRLPTEAEWERAARGVEERRWPWGNTFDPKRVNMRNKEDGWEFAAPVDSMPDGRTPEGLFHMAGNVWEFTSDWFDPTYYKKSPYKNPKGPKSGPRKMIRGGSWRYDIPFYVSSYNRSHSRTTSRFQHVGVRCFKSAE